MSTVFVVKDLIGLLIVILISTFLKRQRKRERFYDERMKQIVQNSRSTAWTINNYLLLVLVAFSNLFHSKVSIHPIAGLDSVQSMVLVIALFEIVLNVVVRVFYQLKFT